MPEGPAIPGGRDHWAKVYATKAATAVSWFQSQPAPSLLALDRFGAGPDSSLIDIGGGASGLVDALVERGWRDLAVLDIAAPALAASQARLGERAALVKWLIADITEWHPARSWQVWHDRAVFHFLTQPEQRAAYRRALGTGLAVGGLLVIATFAPDGPEHCSGLEVQRYDAVELGEELGEQFELLDHWREEHVTPTGAVQAFTWCAFRKHG